MDIYGIDPITKDLILKETQAPRYKNSNVPKGTYPTDFELGFDYKAFFSTNIPFTPTMLEQIVADLYGQYNITYTNIRIKVDKDNFRLNIEVDE